MRDRDKPLTWRELRLILPSLIVSGVWVYLLIGVFWYAELGRTKDDMAQNNFVDFKAQLRMGTHHGGNARLYDNRFGFQKYACSLLPREACDDGAFLGPVEQVELTGKRALIWRGEEKGGVILEAYKNGQPWFRPEFVLNAIESERRWAGIKSILFVPWTFLTVTLCRWTFRKMEAEKLAIDKGSDK
jgi:hypothetical protein